MISIDIVFKFDKDSFIDENGKPVKLSVLDQEGYEENFYLKLICVYTANNINKDGILVYPSSVISADNSLMFHVLVFPNGKPIPNIRMKAVDICIEKLKKVILDKILILKKDYRAIEIKYDPYIVGSIEHIDKMVQLHGIEDPSFVPLTTIPQTTDDLIENYKNNPISVLLEDTFKDEFYRLSNISGTKFCEEFRGVPRCYIIPKTDKIEIAKLLCDKLFNANLSMSVCILFRDMIRYDLCYKDRQVFVEDDFILYEGNPIVLTIDDLTTKKTLLLPNEASVEYVDINIFKEYKEKYYNTTPLLFATDSDETAKELVEIGKQYGIYVDNLLPSVKTRKAKTYLKLKAQQDGFKRFYGTLPNTDNEFGIAKLNEIYSNWKLSYINRKIGGITKLKNNNEKIKSSKDILNEMVGLKPIKSIINNILSTIKMQEELKKRSLVISNPCRHMVFYGNPGTAKTTVARLLGRILKENNILDNGKFIEVGKSDLVAGYVGQTPMKTKAKIDEAKGGILFIDEAYALQDDYYGKECIDTIVKEMENIREDTIIIFAGYKDNMESFLKSNRGLSSRIAFHVEFNDYSKEELLDITKLILKEKHYTITSDALSAIGNNIEKHMKDKGFGNGRFVRNILEQSMMKQATRLTKTDRYKTISNGELTKLKISDIVDLKEEKSKVIGF